MKKPNEPINAIDRNACARTARRLAINNLIIDPYPLFATLGSPSSVLIEVHAARMAASHKRTAASRRAASPDRGTPFVCDGDALRGALGLTGPPTMLAIADDVIEYTVPFAHCMCLKWPTAAVPAVAKYVRLKVKRPCRRVVGESQSDPNVWSGRALQEGFVDLLALRSCINVSGL